MEQKLHKIYEQASAYINGDGNNSPINIITEAATLYGGQEIPEPLTDVFSKCMLYVNKDFDKPISLEEYIVLVYDLVEQLSGTLGEYFDKKGD